MHIKRDKKWKLVHFWNNEKKRKNVKFKCKPTTQWEKKKKTGNLYAYLWNNKNREKMKIYSHACEITEILYTRLEKEREKSGKKLKKEGNL